MVRLQGRSFLLVIWATFDIAGGQVPAPIQIHGQVSDFLARELPRRGRHFGENGNGTKAAVSGQQSLYDLLVRKRPDEETRTTGLAAIEKHKALLDMKKVFENFLAKVTKVEEKEEASHEKGGR